MRQTYTKAGSLEIDNSSPPGIHEGSDSTLHEAVLENNQRILVPQFIKAGDVIKVDVESGKYLDRVKK